jgi:hypothetical protein
VAPPSIASATPVTNRASSLSRNATKGRDLIGIGDAARRVRRLQLVTGPVGADGLLPRVGGGGRRHRLAVVAACSLWAAGRGDDVQ